MMYCTVVLGSISTVPVKIRGIPHESETVKRISQIGITNFEFAWVKWTHDQKNADKKDVFYF